MTLKELDEWLPRLYYMAQVLLLFVAILAAFAAYTQFRTFKLFEILKFIEAPNFRKARRIVIREIEPKKDQEWWSEDKDGHLEEAASTVCAFYDVIGRLMQYDGTPGRFPARGQWAFFREHWAASIVRTHDALLSFLRLRRSVAPKAYAGFTQLAEAARPHAGLVKDRTSN
jgi:hypothetical protein